MVLLSCLSDISHRICYSIKIIKDVKINLDYEDLGVNTECGIVDALF